MSKVRERMRKTTCAVDSIMPLRGLVFYSIDEQKKRTAHCLSRRQAVRLMRSGSLNRVKKDAFYFFCAMLLTAMRPKDMALEKAVPVM